MILGIDIGFVATGVVVIDGKEVVRALALRTDPGSARVAEDDARRCMLLAGAIDAILAQHPIHEAAAELPHGGAQGARAHRSMGLATGVVAAVLVVRGVAVTWVSPSQAKLAVAGRRQAPKEDVQAAVRQMLTWREWPERKDDQAHVADAAAAVLAATRLRAGQRWPHAPEAGGKPVAGPPAFGRYLAVSR